MRTESKINAKLEINILLMTGYGNLACVKPQLQTANMSTQQQLGQLGETIAREHLQKLGYKILETNWRYGRDEIDIIAKHANELVIVEVKTRATDFFGDPHGFVSNAQQKRLINAADAYIHECDWDGETRFDVIGIVISKGQRQFRHIQHAFIPTP